MCHVSSFMCNCLVSCVMFHVSHVMVMCHVSCVMYHVSCVMCHVSCVMCHVSCVMCHVSMRPCVMCQTSQTRKEIYLTYQPNVLGFRKITKAKISCKWDSTVCTILSEQQYCTPCCSRAVMESGHWTIKGSDVRNMYRDRVEGTDMTQTFCRDFLPGNIGNYSTMVLSEPKF